MSEPTYREIVKHYEDCLSRYGDTCRGVDWPNERDAMKRYSVMLGVIRDRESIGEISLLDFGCGASHLYDYICSISERHNIKYTGLDLSEVFCNLSKIKYPENEYLCLDVLAPQAQLSSFDYVVMNGVFTEKRELGFDAMFDYLKKVLREVFSKTRVGLAFNVMSKLVDWERDDLFHLPMDQLVSFLCSEISRHFVIRNDYGLYEYTVYIYKEHANG